MTSTTAGGTGTGGSARGTAGGTGAGGAVLTIELPSMVAGRAMADALVDRLEGELAGASVLLDCRHLLSGSPSFAARLVGRLLVAGGAGELRAVAPTDAFARALADAAAHQDVGHHLVLSEVPLPA